MMVVFLGPDGSGKSSVIEAIRSSFDSRGIRVEVFHLRFPVFKATRQGSSKPVDNPHGQKNYSLPLSLIKLLYFWLVYTLGFLMHWQAIQDRKTLLILDRYFHDLLVDPRRYRYGGPLWAAKAISRLIPKPHHFILLDAPADVLQARKQEVPFAETERQRNAYLALAQTLPTACIVDASMPLEAVIRDVEKALSPNLAGTPA